MMQPNIGKKTRNTQTTYHETNVNILKRQSFDAHVRKGNGFNGAAPAMAEISTTSS